MKYFIALLLLLSFGYTQTPEHTTRVKLDITADKAIEGRVNSYISRELRSIGDVVVVDNKYDYEISLVCTEVVNKGGESIGVTFSVYIGRRFKPEHLINYWLNFYPSVDTNFTKSIIIEINTRNVSSPEHHSVIIGNKEDLRTICENIVAIFDSEILEPNRLYQQNLLDEVK